MPSFSMRERKVPGFDAKDLGRGLFTVNHPFSFARVSAGCDCALRDHATTFEEGSCSNQLFFLVDILFHPTEIV
jgi:hypothetical protein